MGVNISSLETLYLLVPPVQRKFCREFTKVLQERGQSLRLLHVTTPLPPSSYSPTFGGVFLLIPTLLSVSLVLSTEPDTDLRTPDYTIMYTRLSSSH